MTRRFITRAAALLVAALGLVLGSTPALPQSNSSRISLGAPKAAAEARFLAPDAPAVALRLTPIDPARIEAVKRANTVSVLKRLQIGVGRRLEGMHEASGRALSWVTAPGGGMAARWEVTSPGARALRVELSSIPEGVELRFAGIGAPAVVYGPFTAADFADEGRGYWSPVLEGETAIVEVHVADPAFAPSLGLSIARVSHLFVSPSDPKAESLAKDASGACEVDLICLSASDAALAQAGRAVARMVFTVEDGNQALCTGTLLNPNTSAKTPYFYSANHCISTQASADTLTTHWFYDAASCGSTVVSSQYVQLPGGATLLFANQASDGLLLRLKSTPPAGAVYSGWNANTISTGTALTAIHHPAGDVKKVSLGTMGGYGPANGLGPTGSFIISRWNSTATGVTEPGSSGSGIFTLESSEYRLRGGLLGGPSSCAASSSDLLDYYSRLDQIYPYIAVYLNPTGTSCTYSLSPGSASAAAAGASGTVTVNTQPGCAWAATSTVDWITATSTGSGSGTLSYSIGGNGATTARTGTILVANQGFTVTQAGDTISGTNVVSNPGFESGASGWVESATSGVSIIYTDGTAAHTGSGYAYLGGYTSGTDSIYQDVTIPANASQAQLRFWYRITTSESGSSPYDVLTVAVENRTTGARLATVVTLSNADATSGYVRAGPYDLSAFKGQTVRLRFTATNDFSDTTNFFVDDISLSVVTGSSAAPNYTALWWNPSESGWGINVNHQGDILFATLFDYDLSGKPMWWFMSEGRKQADGSYSGALYAVHDAPPFDAQPFTPISAAANLTQVGTMRFAFSGASTGTLTYSVNGITVTKSIQKQPLLSTPATCTGTTGSRDGLTNYQDLWWNPAESGWGINLTQEANVIFATLFDYDSSGNPMWWFMSNGTRQADGSYAGTLYSVHGMSAFNAQPFTPINPSANLTEVGSMSLRFSNGTTGTLTYTIDGTTVVKPIVRQVFSSPVPACSG
ncbi:MAG TPA: BACON domain-containing carbohydrate-binding protein [Usitatibacter sp.]|nr:BACON domain-containing carbohydrate-binding protein [Usitatibacter sp.]